MGYLSKALKEAGDIKEAPKILNELLDIQTEYFENASNR